MSNQFIKKSIHLKSENDIHYYLKGITKSQFELLNKLSSKNINSDEYKKLIINLGVELNQIVAFGDTETTEEMCRKYLEYTETKDKKGTIIFDGKCYAKPSHIISPIIIHHSALSQWNCLIKCVLQNPDYIIIFKSNIKL